MDNRGKDVRGNLRDKWAAQRSVCRERELQGGWSQTVEDDLLAGEESELCLVGECLVALKIIFIVLNPKYISSTLSSSGYQIYIPSYLLDIFTWRFCKHFKQHSWKRPLTVHYFWPTLLLLPFFFFFTLGGTTMSSRFWFDDSNQNLELNLDHSLFFMHHVHFISKWSQLYSQNVSWIWAFLTYPCCHLVPTTALFYLDHLCSFLLSACFHPLLHSYSPFSTQQQI